jgi:iron(III) transport system substrate-binding protein
MFDSGKCAAQPATPARRGAMLASVFSLTAALFVAAALPQAAAADDADPLKSVIDADFNLDALIAAAQKEGSVTVLSTSGDALKVADLFTKKYGIKVNASKSNDNNSIQKMTREASAKNYTIDLALFEDGPSLGALLLPQKIVYSWVPADLQADIPDGDKNPLSFINKEQLFAYNPKLFPDGCPVKNLWDLTTPEWNGKFTTQDPLVKPSIIWWFNELALTGSDDLAAAYQKKFGKALETDQPNAAYAWLDALAKNNPILATTGEDSAAAVGAPNQTEPRIGFFSNATFRDIETKSYQLKVCSGLTPWAGFVYPTYPMIATNAPSPNAAKLFVRFLLTQEGVDPYIHDGGAPTIKGGKAGEFPPGMTGLGGLSRFNSANLAKDFENAQQMQDFWRNSHGG